MGIPSLASPESQLLKTQAAFGSKAQLLRNETTRTNSFYPDAKPKVNSNVTGAMTVTSGFSPKPAPKII